MTDVRRDMLKCVSDSKKIYGKRILCLDKMYKRQDWVRKIEMLSILFGSVDGRRFAERSTSFQLQTGKRRCSCATFTSHIPTECPSRVSPNFLTSHLWFNMQLQVLENLMKITETFLTGDILQPAASEVAIAQDAQEDGKIFLKKLPDPPKRHKETVHWIDQ